MTLTIEEKKAVLSGQKTKEDVARLRDLVWVVPATERSLEEAKATVRASKESLEIEEARLSLSVEGKNAEERKANLVIFKDSDEDYHEKAQAVRMAEGVVIDRQESYDRVRREFMVLMKIIDLRAAQINFLGGRDE